MANILSFAILFLLLGKALLPMRVGTCKKPRSGDESPLRGFLQVPTLMGSKAFWKNHRFLLVLTFVYVSDSFVCFAAVVSRRLDDSWCQGCTFTEGLL